MALRCTTLRVPSAERIFVAPFWYVPPEQSQEQQESFLAPLCTALAAESYEVNL